MFDACICVEVDELCEVLDDSLPVAGRPRKCDECGGTIQQGEIYERQACIDPDGDHFEHKTCLGCVRVRDSLFKCSYTYGQIWNDIHEAYCDNDFCMCPDTPTRHKDKEEAVRPPDGQDGD